MAASSPSHGSFGLSILDAATLDLWREEGVALLIDVREPAEHSANHIPESQLMPLSSFSPSQLAQEEGKMVVLYCRSGNRSERAAQRLLADGWDRVHHLGGGIEAWKEAGKTVSSAYGDSGPRPKEPMSLERQVRIVAGSLVVLFSILGALVTPWFLLGTAAVGAGLVHAGSTDSCAMGMILARLPYNQRSASCP